MKFKQIFEAKKFDPAEALTAQLGFPVRPEDCPIMNYYMRKNKLDNTVTDSIVVDAYNRRMGKCRAEFTGEEIEPVHSYIASWGAKEYYERDEDALRRFPRY